MYSRYCTISASLIDDSVGVIVEKVGIRSVPAQIGLVPFSVELASGGLLPSPAPDLAVQELGARFNP